MAVLDFKCRPYVNFIRGISTKASRVDYDQALKTFMNYLRKEDPAQLINGSARKMENRIMDFIADQKKKGLSHSTIRQRIAAIKHFYEMNRVLLSWKVVTRTIGKPSSKKDRGYTHEEIKKLLEIAKPREHAA
ncbi:MAG: site-specific integrase, partial [Nitrososphaera sp.]|nr:site-specific integrase [Nitrososphaera sp.]